MKVLIIGAHPDDPEYHAGGIARKYTRAGHEVRFVSMTKGDAGHQSLRGPVLAERRHHESLMASSVGHLEYQILNFHDGKFYPTIEARDQIIAMIRQYHPDLVITHRPNDYHPDHRYTSLCVQDASFLLTVPAICPQVPALRKMPVIAYMEDQFTKPIPFMPNVAISIDDTIQDKVRMLHCHTSQFYEWLPYNMEISDEVPADEVERLQWLGERTCDHAAATANKFRKLLVHIYGEKGGQAIRFAEALEFCEYGRHVPPDQIRGLFPF